jgi:hypothetical protein
MSEMATNVQASETGHDDQSELLPNSVGYSTSSNNIYDA